MIRLVALAATVLAVGAIAFAELIPHPGPHSRPTPERDRLNLLRRMARDGQAAGLHEATSDLDNYPTRKDPT